MQLGRNACKDTLTIRPLGFFDERNYTVKMKKGPKEMEKSRSKKEISFHSAYVFRI